MSKEKTKKLLITVGVIVAALLVIGLAVYNSLYNSGIVQRSTTAVKTDNYSVDGMMFAYFYNSQLQNYASAFSYLGVDTSKSLKEQDCPYMTEGGSWFDYLVSVTRDYVINMLSLCEIGRENGNDLSDAELTEIDEQIDVLAETAESVGYGLDEYLRLMTGNAVKRKDVKNCLKLTSLAQKAYSQVMDSFTYTDEQLDAYAAENAATLMGVDYYSYTFNASAFRQYDADDNPTSSSAEESEAAQNAANRLSSASAAADFESTLRSILSENGMSGEELDAAVSGAKRHHAVTSALPDDVRDWADTASAGDATVIGSESGDSYTTYLLTRASYLDETHARNVRHILFQNTTYSDSSKADEVYAEWEASGFSEDKFIELAGQYSEDPGSNEVGGLYEDVTPGAMIDEFDDWLFDSARKPGDHALIESEAYGWHIMYYVGESDLLVWQNEATAALKNSDYNALLAERAASVTFNAKAAVNSIRA